MSDLKNQRIVLASRPTGARVSNARVIAAPASAGLLLSEQWAELHAYRGLLIIR
jgi:hypothetical protein